MTNRNVAGFYVLVCLLMTHLVFAEDKRIGVIAFFYSKVLILSRSETPCLSMKGA
jgi:hypothetical protein